MGTLPGPNISNQLRAKTGAITTQPSLITLPAIINLATAPNINPNPVNREIINKVNVAGNATNRIAENAGIFTVNKTGNQILEEAGVNTDGLVARNAGIFTLNKTGNEILANAGVNTDDIIARAAGIFTVSKDVINRVNQATNNNAQNTVANVIRHVERGSNLLPSRDFIDRIAGAVGTRSVLNRVAITQSPDILNTSTTSIQNGQFTTDSLKGISKFRPEILSLINFVNVYDQSNELNNAGKLLSINYQMRALRRDALKRIESQLITNPQTAQLYTQLKSINSKTVNETRSLLDFYRNNVSYLNIIREAFDVKRIPRENYNLVKFLPLEDFFTQKMIYSRESYTVFSDTKILGQLLFDLRSILENYSISLLNATDADRIGDLNQITYDKTYNADQGFTFSLKNIRGKFLYQESDFNSFNNSLPTNPDDKIKLLLTLISKELRISKGLTRQNVSNTLSTFYQAQTSGSPFDNLIGNIGNDIFEKPSGLNSLSSLLFIEDVSGASVLPFEQKVVDDVQTVFIPGTKYFLDNILNLTNGAFNTKPLLDYSQIFSNVSFKASSMIKELFDAENFDNTLIPTNLFVSFIESFLSGLDSFQNTNRVSNERIKRQLNSIALFRLCNKNTKFKFLVFQYLLLYGMANSETKTNENIFKNLINEIRVLNNLASIRIENNEIDANILSTGFAGLYPYITKTATDIKNEALKLFSLELDTDNVTQPITDTDITNCFIAPFDNLFGSFINLCYKLDIEASNENAVGSYFINLINDPNHTKVTKNNQLCISSFLLMVFEVFASFCEKYFDATFVNDRNVNTLSYNLQKNTFSYKIFKEQIPLTGFSLATAPETANLVGLNSENATSNINIAIAVPLNTGAPRSKNRLRVPNTSTPTEGVRLAPSQTINTINSLVGPRIPGTNASNIVRDSNRNPLLTPQRDESGIIIPDSVSNSNDINLLNGVNNLLAVDESKYLNLRASLNQIFYKIEEEDKIILNALHIIEVISDKLSNATQNTVSYFNSAATNPAIVSNSFTSNLGYSQVRTSQWIFDQYKDSPQPFGGTTKACSPLDFKALLSMLKEPFARKNLANSRTKILAVGIPNGFIEKLTDRITRDKIGPQNLSEDTQMDLVYINIYKKSAEDDDIIFYPQKFLFDLSLFPKKLGNISINKDFTFEQILKKYKASDYSDFVAKDVGLDELNTLYKYNVINAKQKLELLKNHCQSQYLQLYIKYLSGISFDESSFPLDEYPVPSSVELPAVSQNLIKLYIQNIAQRANGEELTATITTLLNDNTLREDIKDDLQMMTFGSTLMQPELFKTKVLAQKKFDRVLLIPFNIDEFGINETETVKTISGFGTVNNHRFIKTTETKYIGDNEVFYKNREFIPNALIFEDYFITIETVI